MYCFLQSAFRSKLGWTESASFLEQFRYIIVASQLLNEHSNIGTYRHLGPSATTTINLNGPPNVRFSLLGVSTTGVAAFVLAWTLHGLRRVEVAQITSRRVILISVLGLAISAGFYFYVLQQGLNNVRGQVIRNASSLVESAQNFDAAASSAVALIQEVELVSRGYRMYVFRSVRSSSYRH